MRRRFPSPPTRFGRRPSRVGLGAGAVGLLLFLLTACSAQEEEPEGFKVLSQPAAKATSKKKAAPALPSSSIWETPLDDPELEAGRVVWTGTCIQCHSTGLGGAPLIGNAELWQPRIDQGFTVLVEHATQGFYGKKGEMPARGGNESLSDEDVTRAVRFMASRVDPTIGAP